MGARYFKHTRALALTASAAVLVTIGSTMAYFSSTDETTNRFDSTKFDIALTEPAWRPADGLNAVPGDVLPKDPTVTNKESVPAYVFLRVTVPCGKPEIEYGTGEKGAVQQAKDEAGSPYPVYKFVAGEVSDDTFTDKQQVNDGWTLIDGYPQVTGDRLVYVYAYTDHTGGLRILEKDETTVRPLFDKIRITNFDENYSPAGDRNILVEALGIQADYLGISENAAPADVWAILSRG